MADAVIFSDIMAHLTTRLTTALATTAYSSALVLVEAEDLTSEPLQVVLRQDGGSRTSKTVKSSVVSVNIFAPTFADAEGLSLLVEALFDDLADGNPIVLVTAQSSVQDVTDMKSQRRFMRFAVDHRGTNLSNFGN